MVGLDSQTLRDVIRLTYALINAWMDSYPRPPRSITLDLDDTRDVVHGHQQLSLFNAHYDERHKSWTRERRAVARIEATSLGLDIRFVVTSLSFGSAKWL